VFAWYGALNSITLATLKTLSPGVPDFYQGHEAIELSLVDPDNRRAVDFERRRVLLAEMQAIAGTAERSAALRGLVAQAVDGRAKFCATWAALQLRRTHETALRGADYVPLEVRGTKAQHALAFARREGAQWVVVVGARLCASFGLRVGEAPIGDAWGDTVIVWPTDEAEPPALHDAISGRQHVLQGGTLPLAALLRDFSVAALGNPKP
jgi:(1->4)-alpha-D-glucan 1-alpha-D-glucosylmutase